MNPFVSLLTLQKPKHSLHVNFACDKTDLQPTEGSCIVREAVKSLDSLIDSLINVASCQGEKRVWYFVSYKL